MFAQLVCVACLIGVAVVSGTSYQDCREALYGHEVKNYPQIWTEIKHYIKKKLGYKNIYVAGSKGWSIEDLCWGLYEASKGMYDDEG